MPFGERSASVADLGPTLDARYRRALVSFFSRRIKNPADAENLAQETLLRAIRVADLGRVQHVERFVFKIAVNVLRDHQRHLRRAGAPEFVSIDDALEGDLGTQLVEELTPERVLLGKEHLADVLRALDELGGRTRNIFVLFRLEHMKHKEIAALYGIAQSTVEKHVMKAVLHLATRYGRK